jgi:glycosyltransferase involved in cell wall biosynthesis
MISDDFLPGATGVGIHIQCIARELTRRGARVSVITSRRKGEPAFEVWNEVKVYRTFTVKIYGFYQALPSRSTVKNILKENDIDIIHYHYLGMLLMRTYKAAKPLKARHIYTYHMAVEHLTQPMLMKPFHKLFFNLHVDYCNRFDLILAPSRGLAGQIKEFGIQTPVRFLNNPIVIDSSGDTGTKHDHEKFIVLYAGRLGPEKNLPYLFKAFALLIQKHRESELWIAGEGPMKSRLVMMSREMAIEDSVKFLGFIKHADLPQYYTAADVFVLPSVLETQGMVVAEAMHFAKPVIVTDRIVSARELVDEGKNGFIVNADSIADLEEKLLLLSRSAELRDKMGRHSLQKSESYSPEKVVDQLEQYYFSII